MYNAKQQIEECNEVLLLIDINLLFFSNVQNLLPRIVLK